MNEQTLLRLAITLDDHAATTIDKYICKLVENALFFSTRAGLSSRELAEILLNDYSLEFDTV